MKVGLESMSGQEFRAKTDRIVNFANSIESSARNMEDNMKILKKGIGNKNWDLLKEMMSDISFDKTEFEEIVLEWETIINGMKKAQEEMRKFARMVDENDAKGVELGTSKATWEKYQELNAKRSSSVGKYVFTEEDEEELEEIEDGDATGIVLERFKETEEKKIKKSLKEQLIEIRDKDPYAAFFMGFFYDTGKGIWDFGTQLYYEPGKVFLGIYDVLDIFVLNPNSEENMKKKEEIMKYFWKDFKMNIIDGNSYTRTRYFSHLASEIVLSVLADKGVSKVSKTALIVKLLKTCKFDELKAVLEKCKKVIKYDEYYEVVTPDGQVLKIKRSEIDKPEEFDKLVNEVAGSSPKINNFKVLKESSAEEVNTWWKEVMGYDNPPYKPGTMVQEIELTEKTTFVRVYDGDVSGMYGGWVMRAEDIKGLTPAQIQDKFALPKTPKYVADVNLDAGVHIRTGIVNPLEGWGNGGGTQFDLMGQRTGEFVNPRPLQ